MNMRKRVFLILFLIFAIGLTGCSQQNNDFINSIQETAFKVLGSDNNEVLDISNMSIKGVKVTGQSGLFKAPLEVNETYEITASADGYKDYSDKYKTLKRNSFCEIKLERKKVDVMGKIYEGNEPLQGVNVNIKELGESTITNSEGIYYFTDIPASIGEDDKYTFEMKKENYNNYTNYIYVSGEKALMQEVDSSYISGESGTVSRNVFEYKSIDLGDPDPNSLPGTIIGKLVDSNEAALVLANATITGAGTTTSDSEGNFILDDVMPGIYVLSVIKDGYKDKYITNVVVEGNKETNLGDIEMEGLASGFGDLDVTVYDESDNIISANLELVGTGITATSGSDVEFKGVPEGTHNIKATKSGYFSNTSTATILSDQTTLFSIQLISENALSDKGTVKGYVRLDDGSGRAIRNATVTIGGLSKKTDDDGYYEIVLPEGKGYVVNISREFGGSATPSQSTVDVVRGETSTVNFIADPLPDFGISASGERERTIIKESDYIIDKITVISRTWESEIPIQHQGYLYVYNPSGKTVLSTGKVAVSANGSDYSKTFNVNDYIYSVKIEDNYLQNMKFSLRID